MRKLILPLAFISGSTALACSFEMGSQPQTPPPPPATAVAPAAKPVTPAATSTIPRPKPKPIAVSRLGHARPGTLVRPGTTPSATPSGSPSAAPSTPPGTPPLMTGSNMWGSGTFDANGFKGAVYVIPAGATAVPKLDTMNPAGFFFTPTLNVAEQTMTAGFPGINATLNQNFAIRFEAPLVVDTEADYTFRVVADDGALVDIDDTPIVNDDGVHATPATASGPVHLVVGTHVLTVDYFQTTAGVSLQLFCTKAGGTEQVCPTHIQ